ncbi:MAG TPA: EAL domain-containing protein [Novosphingobium sp.]|nr:EAL domain-containing protein [Novosphingobium sp.]
MAIMLARHEAIQREDQFVRQVAGLLLARAEGTAEQLRAGAQRMRHVPSAERCADAGMDTMRRINLSSTMLQGVGHLSGNVIRCSTFSGTRSIDLGPPSMTSALGNRIWSDVPGLDGEEKFIAVARGDFVAIIHAAVPPSLTEQLQQLSLGVFSVARQQVVLERTSGLASGSSWASRPAGIYREAGSVTAVVHSSRYDIGAYASFPTASGWRLPGVAMLGLVALSLLVGLALSTFFVKAMRARTSMPGLIRWGLRNGEFKILFQPIIDLAGGATTGAEVLVRWERPDGEVISPETFIPVAEGAGVIRLVTAEVLRLLEPDVRRLVDLKPDFYVSVNFSADDIHWPGIVGQVERFLARSHLPAANLVIEATERSFVDAERAQATLRALRTAGVTIAIDDFGTGYSSLAYLARLSVDCIKIDRLFIQSLGTESATSQVAARIIDMARDLGIGTIAEGVETAEQARLLQALGVSRVQGYFYDEPLGLAALVARLEEERAAEAGAPAVTV